MGRRGILLLAIIGSVLSPEESFAASAWEDSFDTDVLTESISNLYRAVDSYTLDIDRSAPNAYPVDPTEVFYQETVVNGTTYNGFTFPQETGTIEVWANGIFTNTGEDSIVSNWTGTKHMFLRTYALGGAEANFQVAFENPGQPSYAFAASGLVADNEWNFFTITWDVNAGVADVYANGVLVRHDVINDPTWRPSAQVFTLGTAFAGQISHARVLSKYVDGTQVRSDYGSALASSGTLRSKAIEPVSLSSWGSASWTATVPAHSTFTTQVEYDNGGSWDLLPEGVLTGNAAGFASSPVSLVGVNTTTYPKIRLRGNFTTSDTVATAELLDWQVSWTSALGAHPRMYLDPTKITFLKAKIAGNEEPYKAHWLAIKASADASLLVTPPAPTDAIVTDPDQQGAFRTIGNRLPAMALAYLITDDITYLNGTKTWMNALVSYDHWHGDESLGAAHGLYNMAIAYDWLYNDLTGGERTTYETKIALQTERFYDAMNRVSPVWWQGTAYNGNHNFIDVGAMMTGAVALYDVAPGADIYIHKAYDNFTNVLGPTQLIPDGTSQEGISYWSYGMEALLRYFELEEDMFGVNRALTSPNIQNLPFYRLYGGMPNYWQTITMGDTRNWDYYGPSFILMRVASLFNDPMAQWLAQKINDKRVSSGMVGIDSDWRTLLWYDESVLKQDVSALPTYRLFPYLELFTSRSSWTDDNALMFAMKAGPPGGHGMAYAGGHVHPDEGGFTLREFGKDLVIDDEYSYLKMTSNHNVATFGGVGQLGEGSIWFGTQDVIDDNGTADIIYTDLDDAKGYEYLIADLTDIYNPSLEITTYLRHFILLKKGTLIIIDEIESNNSQQVEWRLHLNYNSTFAIDGRTLSGTIDGSDVGLVVDDISEEAHTYSLGKETISASGDGTTSTFNSNTFQILKTESQARIETVLRPFQGTAPSTLEFSRKNGYLVVKLDDNSYTAISTDSRAILMDVDPDNINGLPVVSHSSKKAKKKPSSIHDFPNIVNQGTILMQSGKNFPKWRNLLLYFSRPDGSYYTPQQIRTNWQGKFKLQYKVNKPPGKYKWYARDTISGKKTTGWYTVR